MNEPDDPMLRDPMLDGAAERLRASVASVAAPTAGALRQQHRRRQRRRATRTTAVAAVALVVVGGGVLFTMDGDRTSEIATVDSTSPTSPSQPGEPRVELGAPVDCPTDIWVGSDTADDFALTPEMTDGTSRRPQEELAPTMGQVTAYAFDQPDVVAAGFDNDPTGSLAVAVFAEGADLAAHLAALRGLVEHPDSVVVRVAPYTLPEMMAAQAELAADPSVPAGALLMTGPHWSGLQVQLRADQLPLAQRFSAEHPGMVQFVIGAKRYRSQGDGSLRRCAGSPPITVRPLPTGTSLERTGPAEPGGIYVEGAEYPGSAPAGIDVGVDYELRSDRPFTWKPEATGPVEGVVVRAGTDEVVGAVSGRVRTMAMPTSVTVGAGETMVITVLASTGSADDDDDPALPPGEYEVLASIEIDGERRLLPRVPVTLAPASEFAPDYCAAPSCD